MDTKRFLTIVLIIVSSGAAWARAEKVDCPRPVLWERYPQIKRQVDEGLAKLPAHMAALKPQTFVAKYPKLAEKAKSKDWTQRMRALRAIAALEDHAGIPLLVAAIMVARVKNKALLDDTLNVLTMWIATRSPRDKFKPLAPLFLDILVNAQDSPTVRCRCLQGLGNLADRDWLPIVKDLLVSRHPAVTNMSLWVTQQMRSRPGPGDDTRAKPAPAAQPHQSRAIEVLTDVLTGAPASRVRAAAALGELGMKHKIAIPPLLRALSDPNPSVRVAAAQALDSISGHFRQIRPNLNWPSNSKFVPPLISLLADKNAKVRHAAIFCLSRIGPPARAAMKPLVSLYWFDTAQDQAGTLLVALWSIDPDNRASIAVFLDAAKSSEVSTRVFAANAMSHVKVDPVGRGIVRSLAEALADKTWNVRFQAACSLRRLGPVAKSAIPALNVATDDPDERVRRTATQALEVIKRNHPKTPQPSPSPRGRRRHCTGR